MSTATIGAVGIITVNYDKSLKDMIAAGMYDWVNSDITANRFPLERGGTTNFCPKLFDFGPHISSEDAIEAMSKDKFRPGGHAHGLAYGATFPDEQQRSRIACLGSSALMLGHRHVLYLDGDATERRVNLHDWHRGWTGRWCLLGVREVTGAFGRCYAL
jgi:hypothetical protein